MARRGAALLLCVGLLGPGCQRTTGIGAAACPDCDASAAHDASIQPDATPLPIGPSRFGEPGTQADFMALASALEGAWYGVSAHDQQIGGWFELQFMPEAPGVASGRLRITCLEHPDCDPFGWGSDARDARAHYDVLQLTADSGAEGELSWHTPGGTISVPFWSMLLQQNDQTLFFITGVPNGTKAAGARAQTTVVRERPILTDAGTELGP